MVFGSLLIASVILTLIINDHKEIYFSFFLFLNQPTELIKCNQIFEFYHLAFLSRCGGDLNHFCFTCNLNNLNELAFVFADPGPQAPISGLTASTQQI